MPVSKRQACKQVRENARLSHWSPRAGTGEAKNFVPAVSYALGLPVPALTFNLQLYSKFKILNSLSLAGWPVASLGPRAAATEPRRAGLAPSCRGCGSHSPNRDAF